MVQHTFTCSDKESSETALNEQLVAGMFVVFTEVALFKLGLNCFTTFLDLHQEVKVLKAELDLKDSEVSETLAEWKEQVSELN